ncbi:MAG: MauE/DoxX family redox-associated membrane protein [Candidatus Binatia bacterium]
MIDPLFSLVARGALALLFASAAVHKLRDIDAFRRAVEGYELLPPLWAVPAGALLIAGELGLAVGLWLPRVAPVASLGAALLLGLYAWAIAVNLRRGRRDLDCGCGGPARRQMISPALVWRNSLLAAVALLAALPVSGRSLTWFDGGTLVAAVASLALLYAAADGLLANAPGAARLRRRAEPSEIGGSHA